MTRFFGVADQSVTVVARAADGSPVDGLDESDFTIAYRKGVAGAMVTVTPASLAAITTAHADGGVKELDATSAPGAYRVDLPDAAFTSGAGDSITVHCTATGAVEMHLEVELVDRVTVNAGAVAITSNSDITAIKAKTDGLPSDPADASVVAGLIAAVETKVDTVDTVVDAVKAKTDNLPSDPADQSLIIAAADAIVALLGTPAGASLAADIAANLTAIGDVPTAVENADALLARSIAGGANGGRDVKGALKRLRNHVGVIAGTMTVYEADDTTPAWTAALTTAAGDPVSDVNPA